MRRITKFGSIPLALMIVTAGFLALDLFGGAEAAADAPLLYRLESQHPIPLVAYAQQAVPDGPQVHAHVLSTPDGDTLEVRPRGTDQQPLWRESAAVSDEPWRIIRLAIARDGTSVAAGTDDGRLLYLTSDLRLFDTFTEFRTGSPITALDFDSRGEFLSVATFHGDLYLFGRTHHTTQGAFIMHIPAPLPAGALPGQDAPVLGDQEAVRERLFDVQEDMPFSARPWVSTALAGHADGPGATNTRGLYLVAATAYGELYTYNLERIHGPDGTTTLQPHIHRLNEGRCTAVATPLGDLELPCSKEATLRLAEALSPDGGNMHPAQSALQSLARQMARELPLQNLLSPTPVSDQLPLVALEVTQGRGANGQHLIVAALGDGTMEAFRIEPPTGSSPSNTATRPPSVERLWTAHTGRTITHLDLSNLHRDNQGTNAILSLADASGTLTLHRLTLRSPQLASAHLEHRFNAEPLVFTQLSRGDPDTLRSPTSGRYLFLAGEQGTIQLLQVRETGQRDQPLLLWAGEADTDGALYGVDLLDTGGVILGGLGIAVYASLVTIDIDAPNQVDRHQPWRAQAVIDAPDTQVETVTWNIQGAKADNLDSVTGTGETITHAFTREGDYHVKLTILDDRGIEVTSLLDLRVGGKNPVLKIQAPATAAQGTQVVLGFQGTHDPNLPEGSGHGIKRIEVNPFGDARMMEADVETLSLPVTYDVPSGVYRVVATAYDSEDRSTRSHVTITVTAPGFLLDGGRETGSNRVDSIAHSPQTGISVSYGGDGDRHGRLVIRDADAQVIHQEGTSTSGPGRHIASGAITPDGSRFIGGRVTGEAFGLDPNQPDGKDNLQVFEDRAIAWTFVSIDGQRALFVTRDGRFAAGPATLESVDQRFDTDRQLRLVLADERLIHVVAWTTQGEVLLLDGHRPDRGVRDSQTPQGEPHVMAMTPNLDPMGRAWVFFGDDAGNVETWRILGFQIHVQGRIQYDDQLGIHDVVAGRIDNDSRYTLSVTTTATRMMDCERTTTPCGRLYFVDSRGKIQGNVPSPQRETELEHRPAVLLTDPLNQRFFVASIGSDPVVDVYDRIWEDGPVSQMRGFGGRILAGAISDDRSGHLLVEAGRHAWTFAPPTAAMRVGPHDGDGEPQWGQRLHALINTTLDTAPSHSGHGSLIAATWQTEDDELEGLSVEHAWKSSGYKTVRLTLTARVDHPVEVLLIDRMEVILPVWPRPPEARLSATPWNSSADAVTIETGQQVRFDAGDSHHPAGAKIVDYRFHFGTGPFKNGPQSSITHTYHRPGTYDAYVIVTDEHNSKSTSSKIRIEVSNRAPHAAFIVSQPDRDEPPGRVSANVPVHFDASPSHDPDGQVIAYQWVFPGGITSTSKTPTYTFHSTGDQEVSLRVRDDHGTWSPWTVATIEVDTGIRLKTQQDPPDGSFISPTKRVTVEAFVHDLRNWPDEGQGVRDATVTVKVYYDGLPGSQAATSPYETATYTTPHDGWIEHEVAWSGTINHNAGRHRVEVIAHIEGEYGDTQWSEKRVTTFRVEP
jgi:PKD repeat protein